MSKETKLGILITISITILYFGSIYLKGKNIFNTDHIYYTMYDDSNGLRETSPVLYKGIVVGKVLSLDIVNETKPQIKVSFSVEKKISLTSTTEAQSTASMLGLGSACINLIINEGELLPPKSMVIGMIDIGITDKITPTIRSIDELLYVTNKFLLEIAKSTDKISAIFINLELITNKLGNILVQNEKNIFAISEEIQKLILLINDPVNGIKPLLVNINSISADLNSGVLSNYLKKIDIILTNLTSILEKTSKGENSIGKLTNTAEFYDNLNKTIISTDNLLEDLRVHPWRYLNFSIFGGSKSNKKTDHINTL